MSLFCMVITSLPEPPVAPAPINTTAPVPICAEPFKVQYLTVLVQASLYIRIVEVPAVVEVLVLIIVKLFAPFP